MGVCINSANNETGSKWNLIDQDLETDEGKLQSAVTIWRLLDKWSLKDARNDTVSLVELKPKTGRFHQLRKHMVSEKSKTFVWHYLQLTDKTYTCISRHMHAIALFLVIKSTMVGVLQKN